MFLFFFHVFHNVFSREHTILYSAARRPRFYYFRGIPRDGAIELELGQLDV